MSAPSNEIGKDGIIVLIAQRAAALYQVTALGVAMDVTLCHQTCPLDLDGLLNASDGEFSHDIGGIRKYLDRDKGVLTQCFVPRYAAKYAAPSCPPELTIKVKAERAISDAQHNGGFLTEAQIKAIAGEPSTRLKMLLVRCGNGRFLAPAQDVLHFIGIIGKEASDYVRDVSLPSGFAVQGDK